MDVAMHLCICSLVCKGMKESGTFMKLQCILVILYFFIYYVILCCL